MRETQMKISQEIHLRDFDAWCGGNDTKENLTNEDLDTIEYHLTELFPDGMTETEVNDFLWFERDYIAELLGYNDWSELTDTIY